MNALQVKAISGFDEEVTHCHPCDSHLSNHNNIHGWFWEQAYHLLLRKGTCTLGHCLHQGTWFQVTPEHQCRQPPSDQEMRLNVGHGDLWQSHKGKCDYWLPARIVQLHLAGGKAVKVCNLWDYPLKIGWSKALGTNSVPHLIVVAPSFLSLMPRNQRV